MMTIVDVLSVRLGAFEDHALSDLGRALGLERHAARRAKKGHPISASDFLKLCAAIGLDPVNPLQLVPMRGLGDLDHRFLAMGLTIRMSLNGHSLRSAARAMEVSHTAVKRLCDGVPTSVGTVIQACKYLGQHPFGLCTPQSGTPLVSRETKAAA